MAIVPTFLTRFFSSANPAPAAMAPHINPPYPADVRLSVRAATDPTPPTEADGGALPDRRREAREE
jgi:hypothetical protein